MSRIELLNKLLEYTIWLPIKAIITMRLVFVVKCAMFILKEY